MTIRTQSIVNVTLPVILFLLFTIQITVSQITYNYFIVTATNSDPKTGDFYDFDHSTWKSNFDDFANAMVLGSAAFSTTINTPQLICIDLIDSSNLYQWETSFYFTYDNLDDEENIDQLLSYDIYLYFITSNILNNTSLLFNLHLDTIDIISGSTDLYTDEHELTQGLRRTVCSTSSPTTEPTTTPSNNPTPPPTTYRPTPPPINVTNVAQEVDGAVKQKDWLEFGWSIAMIIIAILLAIICVIVLYFGHKWRKERNDAKKQAQTQQNNHVNVQVNTDTRHEGDETNPLASSFQAGGGTGRHSTSKSQEDDDLQELDSSQRDNGDEKDPDEILHEELPLINRERISSDMTHASKHDDEEKFDQLHHDDINPTPGDGSPQPPPPFVNNSIDIASSPNERDYNRYNKNEFAGNANELNDQSGLLNNQTQQKNIQSDEDSDNNLSDESDSAQQDGDDDDDDNDMDIKIIQPNPHGHIRGQDTHGPSMELNIKPGAVTGIEGQESQKPQDEYPPEFEQMYDNNDSGNELQEEPTKTNPVGGGGLPKIKNIEPMSPDGNNLTQIIPPTPPYDAYPEYESKENDDQDENENDMEDNKNEIENGVVLDNTASGKAPRDDNNEIEDDKIHSPDGEESNNLYLSPIDEDQKGDSGQDGGHDGGQVITV